MNSIRFKFSIFSLLMFFPGYSFAYVDPGTGSLLLQSILAAVVGAFFYFRSIFGFRKKKDNSEDKEER